MSDHANTYEQHGHIWPVEGSRYLPCKHCGVRGPFARVEIDDPDGARRVICPGEEPCPGNAVTQMAALQRAHAAAEREAANRNADRLAALEERKVVAFERIADALWRIVGAAT